MVNDDLLYEPPGGGGARLMKLRPRTCLVLGNVPQGERDEISVLAETVRETPLGQLGRLLYRGTYALLLGEEWHFLVVAGGRDPRSSDSARADHTDDDYSHLIVAKVVYEDSWDRATAFASDSLFRVGDIVRTVDGESPGQVRGITRVGDSYLYTVDIGGQNKQFTQLSLVRLDGDPKEPHFWLACPPADAAGISLTLTWTKLRHRLTDTLYSFAASKTLFRAYQFKPVLKLLNGSSGRLLIADEVGLGKTIEAGLVWNELEQRVRLERILVVVPSALTRKWKVELSRRFDREIDILRPADLADFADRLERAEDAPFRGIISLESLRVADDTLLALTALQPRLDLVIVDEAHYLRNRESKSHALGRLLADWSDYLLLLSATPLNLGNDDLFNLMSLLDQENFADREVFEQQLEPNRVINAVARSLSVDGREEPAKLVVDLDKLATMRFGAAVADQPDFAILHGLLDVNRPLRHDEVARARRLLGDLNVLSGAVTRTRRADVPGEKATREARTIRVDWTEQERAYYETVYDWLMRQALAAGTPPGFAMQMPLRLAASCISASQEMLRAKALPSIAEEIDDFDDEAMTSAEAFATLPSITAPLVVDTKYDRLLEELLAAKREGLEQFLIFSFFRGTLRYLVDRLSEHFSVGVMHGGVTLEEREQVMADFRSGRFEVLLSSEVGSEGLDFEFCNMLVNYDLPWNPMRVEQRIGRLDRFGQKHEKIFIYNMRVPGTIESDIFERLYDRIGVFHSSIGELEPILRNQVGDIPKRILNPRLDAEGRKREADRIAVAIEQRRQDVEDLNAVRPHLSGLDDLLVEGLTAEGVSNGRFIGKGEIRHLLEEMFRVLGGRFGSPGRDGTFVLTGSANVAEKLRAALGISDDGSRYSRSRLAMFLQDEEPIVCTFDPEVAATSNAELLSARHPLVKLALDVLEGEKLPLPRFGTVTVPGLPAGTRYLVKLDLAETSGLRPLVELWATAIDLDTREPRANVGDKLLTALAEGTLSNGTREAPPVLSAVWEAAERHAALRLEETERSRRQENAALVESRIRARESSLDIQIRKSQELLERLQDRRIVRLHEGRIRNLREQRLEIRRRLEARKELTLSITAIAAVLAASAEARTP